MLGQTGRILHELPPFQILVKRKRGLSWRRWVLSFYEVDRTAVDSSRRRTQVLPTGRTQLDHQFVWERNQRYLGWRYGPGQNYPNNLCFGFSQRIQKHFWSSSHHRSQSYPWKLGQGAGEMAPLPQSSKTVGDKRGKRIGFGYNFWG